MSNPSDPPPSKAQPSTAQVISAAIQNCLVASAVTAGWLMDKVEAMYAVPALLLIIGVNLPVTIAKKGAGPLVTLMGSTGVLSLLTQLPGLSAVLALIRISMRV